MSDESSDEPGDEPTPTSTKSESVALEVAGRTIDVSNPDKVFFTERGDTKLDLVHYYLAVEGPIMRGDGRSTGAAAAVPERGQRASRSSRSGCPRSAPTG